MKSKILLAFWIVFISTIVIPVFIYLLSDGQCGDILTGQSYHCSIFEYSFPILLLGVPLIAFPAFLILSILFNFNLFSKSVFKVVSGICLILIISYFSIFQLLFSKNILFVGFIFIMVSLLNFFIAIKEDHIPGRRWYVVMSMILSIVLFLLGFREIFLRWTTVSL